MTAVTRFGKHIDLDLDGVHLALGFGRAGWATWQDAGAAEVESAAAVIARIAFDHGILGITDAGEWLSVQLHVVDAADEVPAVAKLGPDAADPAFSRDMLVTALGGRRKQLKALLQEQETLAGIGNAYSDEIMFAARLDPTAHAASLSADEITRLHAALHDTLTAAVLARRGVPIAEQKAAKVAAMQVHGRTGEPCPGAPAWSRTSPAPRAAGSGAPRASPPRREGWRTVAWRVPRPRLPVFPRVTGSTTVAWRTPPPPPARLPAREGSKGVAWRTPRRHFLTPHASEGPGPESGALVNGGAQAVWPECFPSATSSTSFALNAGRSSGLRLETRPWSTCTSSSTHVAPALRRSVCSVG